MVPSTCDSGQLNEPSSLKLNKEATLGGFKFWLKEYFGVDLRALAFTRILLALIVIVQLLVLFPDLEAFFSEEGVLGIDTLYYSGVPFSVFILSKTFLWTNILFVSNLIFAAFLLFGFKTRLSSFIVWFLYLSLISRNWMIINSGDVLLLLMLFWGMFVPWGARFSVDNLSEKKNLLPKKILSVGTAAFILQMPLVYFFTGLIKSADPSWSENFSAVFYSLAPQFITHGGQFLLELDGKILEALTVAVLALEIYGPIFIFFPFFPLFFKWFKINFLSAVRTLIFFMFLLLQLSFYLTLSIGSFPFISIVSLIPILHTSFLDRASTLLRKKSGGKKMKVFYDGDCFFCQKVLNILDNLGLLSKAIVTRAQDNPEIFKLMREKNSWVVIDKKGKKFFKFEALLSVWKENVVTKPIYFICQSYWIKNYGNKIYERVSESRAKAYRVLRFFIKGNYPLKMPLLLSMTCAVFLIFALYSNLSSVKIARMSDDLYQTGKILRMNQRWVMFASPITKVGYLEVEGLVEDGRTVNLSQAGGPIRKGFEFTYEFDNNPNERLVTHNIYKNRHWRKYFGYLDNQSDLIYLESYARYVCNAWQKNLSKEPELEMVTINFIGNERDPSLKNGFKEDWKKRELHSQQCETT